MWARLQYSLLCTNQTLNFKSPKPIAGLLCLICHLIRHLLSICFTIHKGRTCILGEDDKSPSVWGKKRRKKKHTHTKTDKQTLLSNTEITNKQTTETQQCNAVQRILQTKIQASQQPKQRWTRGSVNTGSLRCNLRSHFVQQCLLLMPSLASFKMKTDNARNAQWENAVEV